MFFFCESFSILVVFSKQLNIFLNDVFEGFFYHLLKKI
jgi:hypothetical protein